MNFSEFIYHLTENAVSTNYAPVTISLTVVVSLAIGYISKSLTKMKFLNTLLEVFAIEIIFIFLFLVVQDNIYAERKKEVLDTFNNLDYNYSGDVKTDFNVLTWREGLNLIRQNPYELGYYITSADLLVENFSDYELATIILEKAININKYDPVPPDLCRRLKIYYEHLPNTRPNLDKDCNKEIIVL